MLLADQELNEQKVEEELAYWLGFAKLSGSGLGFARVKRLYEHFESLKEAWQTPEHQLKKLTWLGLEVVNGFVAGRKNINPEGLLAELKAKDIKAFHFYHPDYPDLLRHIYDPPLVLFMKGHFLPQWFKHAVGVVGTRRATHYGQKVAKEIAGKLAENGVPIISGMAVGIDSLAHWGAIEAKGRTVAVLGSGVDYCYPSSNKPLYKALIEGEGRAVISEFFPDTKPEKWHFPARNRIISGLSDALLVVEAGEDSGALITAELAFQQNRLVFAIPGRVDAPISVGTNGLIAKTKAHICRDYMDIMHEMNWATTTTPAGVNVPTVVELYGRERELFELISPEPIHFDYMLEKTGMNTAELSATLTMLELAGVVTRLPGEWYVREQQGIVP